MNDEEKSAMVDAIAALLALKMIIVSDRSMDSQAGGPKPQAIGYVYGHVDAVLRTKGLDMATTGIGPQITFQVIRRLWPGKEAAYFGFLMQNLSNPLVLSGMMHGGQQYLDSLKPQNSGIVPMGLARYMLAEK